MRSYFDLLYMLLGISYNGYGRKYKPLTLAFLTHIIIFTLISTFRSIQDILREDNDRRFEVVFNMFSWIFFILYSKLTSSIRNKFHKSCQSKLTIENSQVLRSIERKYMACLLLIMIVPSAIRIYMYSYDYIVKTGFGDIAELPDFLNVIGSYWYWTVVGFLGINGPLIMTIDYLYTFQKLYLIKREFMLTMTMGMPMKNARKRWREICDLKSLFEHIYSITPLLKFIQTFLQTTMYILQFRNIEAKHFLSAWLITPVVMWICQTLVTIFLVYVIDRANSRLKLIHEFIMKMYIGSDDAVIDKLLNDVKENYRFEMTAYGLFVLNKSVILEFGSALVTFSVLFVQLKGQLSSYSIKFIK